MNTKEECRKIYHDSFGDEADFEDALFENCFPYCRYLEKNGEIVSILFLLPCKINGKECEYLFGVATKKEYQGKGYMTELLQKSIGEKPVFLRPAKESLIGFYKRFGFKTVLADNFSKDTRVVLPTDSFKKLEVFKDEKYEKFTLMTINLDEFSEIRFDYSLN